MDIVLLVEDEQCKLQSILAYKNEPVFYIIDQLQQQKNFTKEKKV